MIRKAANCVEVRRLMGCNPLRQWARHLQKVKGSCFPATMAFITLVTLVRDADLFDLKQLARNGNVGQMPVLRRGSPIRIKVQIRKHAHGAIDENPA